MTFTEFITSPAIPFYLGFIMVGALFGVVIAGFVVIDEAMFPIIFFMCIGFLIAFWIVGGILT